MILAGRLTLVVLSAAVLQRGVFSQVGLSGAVFEVLAVVAIAGGLAAGEQSGAVTGFVAGLTLDLLSPGGPVGLWALTYAVAGFIAGRWAPSAERSRWAAPAAVGALVGAGSVGFYVLVAMVLDGRDLFGRPAVTAALVAGAGAVVTVVPLLWVLRWVWDVPSERSLRLR